MEDAPVVPVMGALKPECHKGEYVYHCMSLHPCPYSSPILYIFECTNVMHVVFKL